MWSYLIHTNLWFRLKHMLDAPGKEVNVKMGELLLFGEQSYFLVAYRAYRHLRTLSSLEPLNIASERFSY